VPHALGPLQDGRLGALADVVRLFASHALT